MIHNFLMMIHNQIQKAAIILVGPAKYFLREWLLIIKWNQNSIGNKRR